MITSFNMQLNRLQEGELYIKRGPRGTGTRKNGGGARTGGRTTGVSGVSGGVVAKTPVAGRGAGASKGSNAAIVGSTRGAGARHGTAATSSGGVTRGGRRTGGAGGGTTGIAGGRAGGGGGGSRRGMVKRQVETESDFGKRELDEKVDDWTLEKRNVDEMQREKREHGDSNEMFGAALSGLVKRSIDQEQIELQKRNARNPTGMHPVKRDVETDFEKRNGYSGHAGTAMGHIPLGGMMKRSPSLQIDQETFIKRSPRHFKNGKGGRSRGSRGRGGMGMTGTGMGGMGMKKRSLGGKERLSLDGPRLN